MEVGVTRVTPAQFRRHLELFKRMDLKPCSLGSYLNEPAEDKVAITFDDAYESVYHYAYPLLKEWGSGGFTVFPVAGYVGDWNRWEVNLGWRRFRHLSWQQLRTMEGVEIGSHTLTHPCLIGLSPAKLHRELRLSREIIEDKLGVKVKYLSLPFSRYDERTLKSAEEAGYEAVCSLNPDDGEDGFVVGRYGVYILDSLRSIRNKLGIGAFTEFERFKLKVFNKLSAGTIMVKRWREHNIHHPCI
ncbi:MAG: polysaccharide deacetylase family protein [candidate division Zixibacteria bacterium]|nr:polysaccharide deacetylase family protein [Candidatus Tariuqbacter arcticus]